LHFLPCRLDKAGYVFVVSTIASRILELAKSLSAAERQMISAELAKGASGPKEAARSQVEGLPADQESEEALKREFDERADRWEREAAIHSAPAQKYLHRDYQFIMARGQPVIPLILKRLEKSRKDWFWALRHIAGPEADPAKDARNFDEAVRAWRIWADAKNHVA
jgi:hypothetical protein